MSKVTLRDPIEYEIPLEFIIAEYPAFDIEVTTITIAATVRRLAASYSLEATQDLR